MKAAQLRRVTMYHHGRITKINKETEILLDEILQLLDGKLIPKHTDDIVHELWIEVPRGSFEEWDAWAHDDDEVESISLEERRKDFYEEFPEETYWFRLSTLRNKYAKVLWVDDLHIEICENEHNFGEKEDWPYDYSEYLQFFKEKALEAISQLENGTYNKHVQNDLPYQYRFGTILRKNYWKVDQEDKAFRLKDLTEDEIAHFIDIVEQEGEYFVPASKISQMTFRKYFEFAKIAYEAAGFEIYPDDIVKLFFRYGEDFGGGVLEDEIDYDSTEDFDAFYQGKWQHGGHPWGLLRGSSRTRIMLCPRHTDDGYYFEFFGNENWCCYEMVKMYTALKGSGLPVAFGAYSDIVSYLKEEDLVGIIPHRILAIYCQMSYPDRNVQDFRHWYKDQLPEMEQYITWLTIPDVKLK